MPRTEVLKRSVVHLHRVRRVGRVHPAPFPLGQILILEDVFPSILRRWGTCPDRTHTNEDPVDSTRPQRNRTTVKPPTRALALPLPTPIAAAMMSASQSQTSPTAPYKHPLETILIRVGQFCKSCFTPCRICAGNHLKNEFHPPTTSPSDTPPPPPTPLAPRIPPPPQSAKASWMHGVASEGRPYPGNRELTVPQSLRPGQRARCHIHHGTIQALGHAAYSDTFGR